jgi:cytochrome c551/c552
MKTKLLLLLTIGALTTGCKYDNEEELYNCAVDAASTKYSITLTAIFSSYGCVGCHSGGVPSGGVTLENYAGVKAAITSGRLFGAVNHDPGFAPMPQGGSKMSSCDIKKVKAWIDAGAPNN